MAVVLSVVCERCRSEFRPDRPVRSFSPGAVRTRAALHGWSQTDRHGVVLDLCPACVQAEIPEPARAVARVLVGAASAASSSVVGPVHAAPVTALGVVVCHWCEEDQHQWCTGCDCPAH